MKAIAKMGITGCSVIRVKRTTTGTKKAAKNVMNLNGWLLLS